MRYLSYTKTDSQDQYTYHIADSEYLSDQRIDALSSFRKIKSCDIVQTSTVIPNYSVFSNLFNDCAHIGENAYYLCVDSAMPTGYLLKTKNQSYQLNRKTIQCNSRCADDTLLLGPVLILNLAMNQVFCLHASAFLLQGKVFILMGESGTGKSTIARFMDDQPGVQRIADDILPLKIIDDNLTVLPNFPQLKLASNDQYKGDVIATESILLFTQKSNDETELTSIDTFETIKSLVKHTVATKLFAKDELQNHLSFCHQVSSKVKSYRLNYQHSKKSLGQLYNLLNEIN